MSVEDNPVLIPELGSPSHEVLSLMKSYDTLSDRDKFYVYRLFTGDGKYEKMYHNYYEFDIPFKEWQTIGCNSEETFDVNRKIMRRWKQIKPFIRSIIKGNNGYTLCLTREYKDDDTRVSLEEVIQDDIGMSPQFEYKNRIYIMLLTRNNLGEYFTSCDMGSSSLESWMAYDKKCGEKKDSDVEWESQQEEWEAQQRGRKKKAEREWSSFIDDLSRQ